MKRRDTRPQRIAAMPTDQRLLVAAGAFLERNAFSFMQQHPDLDLSPLVNDPVFRPFVYTSLTMMQMVRTRTNITVPHPHEVASCCGAMPAWLMTKPPGLYMWGQHCRSLEHVAALFNVPVPALRRAVRTWRRLVPVATTLKGVAG